MPRQPQATGEKVHSQTGWWVVAGWNVSKRSSKSLLRASLLLWLQADCMKDAYWKWRLFSVKVKVVSYWCNFYIEGKRSPLSVWQQVATCLQPACNQSRCKEEVFRAVQLYVFVTSFTWWLPVTSSINSPFFWAKHIFTLQPQVTIEEFVFPDHWLVSRPLWLRATYKENTLAANYTHILWTESAVFAAHDHLTQKGTKM